MEIINYITKKCFGLNRTSNQKEDNYITIVYNHKGNNIKKLNIFHSDFVKKNKDKCKIIYKEKEYELTQYFDIDSNYDDNGLLSIKLKGIDNIVDASKMFYKCKSLLSLPDISNWNTSKVINMMNIFYKCRSLISLSGISNWDTSNVRNMCCMFYGCSSLAHLPVILNWNTSKVSDMRGMFHECQSLKSFPDISKWNIINVKDISYMFYSCKFLNNFNFLNFFKLPMKVK